VKGVNEPALIWLRFDDPHLESAYRADHARRSVRPVRVMTAVLASISLIIGVGVFTGEAPRAVGLAHPLASEPFFWLRTALSLVAVVALPLFVGHPKVLPQQQAFIALLLAFLLLCDLPSTARFPLPYGLASTLLQVMSAYVLLRLRLRFATLLGVTVSASYLAATFFVQVGERPELRDALSVNAGALVMTNVILATACHQIERLDRLAFLGRTRTEQRSRELERALHELQAAQARLLETERQAAVGRLASGLLHELNTPLAALRSSTQTLARLVGRLSDAAPAEHRARAVAELLEAQSAGAERLAEVSKTLERFVDIDRDGVRVVDLREGLRDALRLLGPRLEGLRVDEALPDRPIHVACAPARMNAAFYAILETAARALGSAGPTDLRAAWRPEAGGRWRIAISDDGPGVPAELRPRLFEPGFSRDGGRVRMRSGLALARRAAQAAGGDLRHHAGPQGGATFTFELPAASEDHARDRSA
jgi:signal transduction histidine kinase